MKIQNIHKHTHTTTEQANQLQQKKQLNEWWAQMNKNDYTSRHIEYNNLYKNWCSLLVVVHTNQPVQFSHSSIFASSSCACVCMFAHLCDWFHPLPLSLSLSLFFLYKLKYLKKKLGKFHSLVSSNTANK